MPRPLFPQVTSTVTSRRPTLRWLAPSGLTGARVELCRDRACATVIETIDATSNNAQPSADLPSNRVVFWRLRGQVGSTVGTRTSATWQFRTGVLSAAVDTAHGIEADFNGDGLSDLAVGDTAANANRGAVSVHYGSAAGLSAMPERTLSGAAPLEGFGSTVASVGDINGDGFCDLAVASPSRTVSTRAGAGAIDMFVGSAEGLAMIPTQTLTGAMMGLDFGATVVGLGDVNGDGFSDVAVGRTIDRGGVRVSAVSVHLGSATGLTSAAAQVFDEGYVGSFNGEVIAVGDANGDRRQDMLLVAASGTNPRTFSGTADGVSSTPSSVIALSRVTLRAAGDVNADGYADIAVTSAGEARYLAGAADWRWNESAAVGVRAMGFVGEAAALGGDINGDGYADIVLPIEAGMPASAQLAVYRGSVTGPRASTMTFGNATGVLSLRVRGDGLADIAAVVSGQSAVWMGATLSAPLGPQVLSAGRAITP